MESDLGPAKKPTKAKTKNDEGSDVFRTPEEVAADQHSDVVPIADPELEVQEKPESGGSSWKDKLALHWPPGNKEYAVAAVIVLLIAGGVSFALMSRQPTVATLKPIPKVTPKTKTVPSTLTGLPVDPTVNQRTVTGVMIENSLDARPQSGLGQAGVVFEAIAEGGITRFLALFQDTAPENVGPIRSARPYYEQWNLGFDAGYAHVGGSPEALADIKTWNVRDLDQFANGDSYHRISSRAAPHNVYTSIAALNQLEVAKGWTTSKYTGFLRKPKEAPAKQPPAKTIDFAISGPLYAVHYDYSPGTNSYNRGEGGAAHTDENGVPLSPKVVIALAMPYSIAADGYHSEYNTIGNGPAYIFQDGNVTLGQWSKPSNTAQFTFTDGTGKPLALNAGQTWLTAVGAAGNVTYAP